MKRSRLLILALAQTLLISSGLEVNAQQAPVLGLPGSILQDIQQKIKAAPDDQLKTPPPSPIEDTQKQQAVPQEDQAETIDKVFIKKIQFEGITLIDLTEVLKISDEYENRDNSFADIQELTNKLTAIYKDRGYVTSRVYIPPQQLKDGLLLLKALEGHMGNLEIQEGRYFKQRSIKPFVSVKPGDPFNIAKLKLNLRTLNENPDRSIRAILKPGEKTGDTDVVLETVDRFPVHLSPSFDNLGRRIIGDNRLGMKLTNNNMLGFGDTLMSAVSWTRRSFGLSSNYQLPIGHNGWTAGFAHGMSRLQLGEEFQPLDVKGSASTYTPFISKRLYDSETKKLFLELGFDIKQLDTNVLGGDFSHDQLRVLKPALNFEEYDKWGRTYMRHEIGLGLDILGGTDGFDGSPSREGAGSKFFRYTGSLIRTQKLPWSTYAIFRLLGQYTPDRLVSSEQFQIGGAFAIRGYKEGQLSGDNGIMLGGEWRMPFFLLPAGLKIPGTDLSIRDALQLATFLEYGSVFINKPEVGTDRSEHMLGAGIGIRLQLTKYITARLDLGFPLLDQPGDDSSARLHFGISSNLF